MLSDKDVFIGAMLWRLVLNVPQQNWSIRIVPGHSNHVLLINGKHLCVKYSKARNGGTWQFTFTPAEMDTITKLEEKHGECFVAMICHSDGVACLNMSECRQVIDLCAHRNESIRVSRKQEGQQYNVSGGFGKLPRKIPGNSLFRKLS